MTLKHLWDPQLSQKEVICIGQIAVHWAALEYEVFSQTLATFEGSAAAGAVLPKEMNNMQFSGVLELWKERVATTAKGRRGKVLLNQYAEVLRLKPYRDALIHGMCYWSTSDLGAIFTSRIKKRNVITVEFTANDLVDFSTEVAEINFKIRFPGGVTDLVRARVRDGGYISRRAVGMFTDVQVDSEGFPLAHPTGKQTGTEGDA